MAVDSRISVPPPASWWPLALVVVLGSTLGAEALGWVVVEEWAHSGLTILFATAVAAFILGDGFRFILWWSYRRHQRPGSDGRW